MRELESDGLIRKRSAKPAVVTARNPVGQSAAGTSRTSPTWPPSPRTPQLKVKSYRKEKSPVLQRHFGMAVEHAGYCLRSILSVGKQRKAQITTYFPPTSANVSTRTTLLTFSSSDQCRSSSDCASRRACHCPCRDCRRGGRRPILTLRSVIRCLTVEMLYQSADQRNIEFSVARHPADLFSITYDAPNDL